MFSFLKDEIENPPRLMQITFNVNIDKSRLFTLAYPRFVPQMTPKHMNMRL